MSGSRYEVVGAKLWVNSVTGAKASIHGAVPYTSEAEKVQWYVTERDFTIRDNVSGTVGMGRPPFRSAAEARRFISERLERADRKDRTMEDVTVTVQVKVTWQQIEDQLCAAWEGGSNYWLECHGCRPPVPEHQGKVQHRYQNALYPGGAALCRIDGEGDEIELTREKLAAGVQVFADKCPRLFAQMRNDEGDADTGDAFLQCCLLGEIVYG